MDEPEIWYRLDDRAFSQSSGWDDDTYYTVYDVIKHTPRGVWLKRGSFGGKRFVLKDAYRKFACPTLAEALESFIARKEKQADIHRSRADIADRMAAKALSKYGEKNDRLPV